MSEIDQDDKDLQRLMTAAGVREAPPEDMRARVHTNVLDAWRNLPAQAPGSAQSPGPRHRLLRAPHLAMAASVFALLVAGILYFAGSREAAVASWVARVEHSSGSFAIDQLDADGKLPRTATVATAAGQVRLRLASGAMVQMDQNTRVDVLATDTIRLWDGRLYVDGGAGGANDIRIVTAHSTITDIGTLFEVLASGDELTVAMREGTVDIATAGRSYRTQVIDGIGDGLRLQNDQVLERFTVATTGQHWQWVRALREPFAADGRSVYDYLQWAARDSGRILQLRPKVEQSARQETLHLPNKRLGSDIGDIASALETTSFVIAQGGDDHELVVDFLR